MSNTKTAQNALNMILDQINKLGVDVASVSWCRFNYDGVAGLTTPTVNVQAALAGERRIIADAFGLPQVVSVYGASNYPSASQVGVWADIPVKVYSGADEIDLLGTTTHRELSAA